MVRNSINAAYGAGVYARGGLFKGVVNTFTPGRSIKKYKPRVERRRVF